ncbi:hypothetical protein BDV26DRAFT_289775 [Aspergillus bertholletiae]|uniref:Uncharacterized protein n=1 Tax=Aspergillus bertholletiae TaxID=1226010 RepID=A0A5N7BH08_9EURO|nr:hypothetical protein BDV26DRAFT_289775 [Aspergillus bertholletiae]
MPMRWTPENVQLLLLKILETHDLSVDTKKVAEAWPGSDPNSRPTPRAITERLVKMRQIVKTSNNGSEGHFSIGKGAATSPSGAAATPRKRGKNATAIPRTPPSGKRKNASKSDKGLGNGEDVSVKKKGGTPEKQPLWPASADVNQGHAGVRPKAEPVDDDDDDVFFMDEESPSKRVRKASTRAPGMVSSYSEEEDGSQTEPDSEISEYLPEESVKMEEEYLMINAALKLQN